MPDPYFLKPGPQSDPGKLPFYIHTHVWSSPPRTVHQSSLHKPQPIVKRHSAPANPLNDCPSTASWKPTTGTVASTSMEALLVSKFETKLDIPSTPSPGDPPTKDGKFSAAFHIMFFAKLQQNYTSKLLLLSQSLMGAQRQTL